ncbi:pyruvate kinase [Sphingorhabdus sp. 109]|jgi:pyruvate kinase|uniref:pyruvate kinase n=1 Tax=Sphingorhabdus sp. 109 TaxID=2653173 RepID=UPI0012F20746|nr:pyruvate kinase [Sphingorhabdus sp. 109]VWX60620.1 Pyruvate kinase [Sphingorhabdus sp. 109]
MASPIFSRNRKVKVLATLGPSSGSPDMIEEMYRAGVDAFRMNMSHGEHKAHAANVKSIRALEKKVGRPITILADLQGPKLRIGTFAKPPVMLKEGARFTLDMRKEAGDAQRVTLPHKEILGTLQPGHTLLLDDGKIRLEVTKADGKSVETKVIVGGEISDRKGVNVPEVVLPVSSLTDKDRKDLTFALEQDVDWIALSFVQRPEDVAEARRLIRGKAALLAKIEKPAAIDRLDEILELSDAVMVARGDLGVELLPEQVPPLQKKIVAAARKLGRPVVVATQMLESMIKSPTPTRAEVSDVATAIYDGADAIMLSAESAVGDWPIEAATMMDRIAAQVENDPSYADRVHFTETVPDETTADALAAASYNIARTIETSAIVCYTSSGSTARRMARERPSVPLLVLTPNRHTARRVGLLWGAYAVVTRDVKDFEEMIAKAKRMALRHKLGAAGSRLIVCAGVPFGTPGSTNLLHIVRLSGDELKRS